LTPVEMKESWDGGNGGNSWWEAARTVDNLCVANRSDVPLMAHGYEMIRMTNNIDLLRPVAGFIRSAIDGDDRVQSSSLNK
jgi:hypothetical protein